MSVHTQIKLLPPAKVEYVEMQPTTAPRHVEVHTAQASYAGVTIRAVRHYEPHRV